MKVFAQSVPYGTKCAYTEQTKEKTPATALTVRGHGNQKGALISMNTLQAEYEAGRLWRRLPAAERRANNARARADRTGDKEHVVAAYELEMGLHRMEAQYYDYLALIDDEPAAEDVIAAAYLRLFEAIRENRAA